MLRNIFIVTASLSILFSGYAKVNAQESANPSNSYRYTKVEAPFKMGQVKEFVFPNNEFRINFYGGNEGGEILCTRALYYAIEACHEAGGGRVVVPKGKWRTGAIQLFSNVNLHLEEGAELTFTDNPAHYFPGVKTSWGGIECINYAPLIYAYDCENVAVTGKGIIICETEIWEKWAKMSESHISGLKTLYDYAYKNVTVESRNMIKEEYNLRPQLIHFNRCKNILLDGFNIKESPFRAVHLYKCEGGIVRNLNISAHGLSCDGLGIEMSNDLLVDKCEFDMGDDAIAIKSGHNHDAWRLNTPSKNIVIRNCKVKNANALLGIGSELSAGIKNIYMHDCEATSINQMLYIKTNIRRGGYVENIHVKDIKTKRMSRVIEIDADVHYKWKDIVPAFEEKPTRIDGIFIENALCESADAVYEIKGNESMPVNNVKIKNVNVNQVNDFVKRVINANNITEENSLYVTQKK